MKALGNINLLYLSPQCDSKLLVTNHILNILFTTCRFSVTTDLLPAEASTSKDPDTENPDTEKGAFTSVDSGLISNLMTTVFLKEAACSSSVRHGPICKYDFISKISIFKVYTNLLPDSCPLFNYDDSPILHGAESQNRAMKPPIIHWSLSVCWQIAHPAHRHHHLGGGELSAEGQRHLGGVKLLLVLNLHWLIMVLADGTTLRGK